MATVCAVPDRVIVDVPFVNTEPAPLVFHDPVTAHTPAVRTMLPEAPPVMVTLATFTVELPALRVEPLLTVRFPPLSARFAVDRVALLFRVRVPLHRNPLAAMVKVAAAVGLSCTLLNSATGKAPNVMVRAAPALNTTVPVPGLQDADVEELVQDPPMVHVSEPKAK
jgi:hypothetical protein